MAVVKLPPVGDDAFVDGCLNKKFVQGIIDRVNRVKLVKMPAGWGEGKVIESEQNIVIDLSNTLPLPVIVDGRVAGQPVTYTLVGKINP